MASGSNVTLNVGANLNPTNLVRQLNQVQAQHGTFNMTLNTKGFRQPLGRITGDLGEFQNALDASIARTLAFGAAVGVVNGVANAFKAMVSSAIDVEKKLADINVILNESQKGLADFSNKLFEVAKNTGQSFDAVSDAAVELARQGLGAEETLKRINDAMILTRLSGMDAAKSVETLTAAVNGFGQSALTTTQLVNKLATVDAAFAVSTEDLANALARAGSSAQAAKVDLDQLLAAVTSVQQQTARGGAVIGNAFKSIFTRIQRSGVREALEEIGVATTDAAGNIRGALDILKDYAGVYSSLTDQQRAYTDELVAGVFQINNLKALVKDLGSGFSIYDRALSQSANATDEATRRNKALGETLASLVNEAAVNVKALAASLGNLVATPAIQNLLNMFNSISEALVKALDPEKGSKLIQGMFKGIGAFIAGPGLIIVGAAFVKLFKFITGQSVRALKEVFKINTAAQKTKQIEAELSAILTNNTQLYQQISNQSLTRQQREQMVLNAINAETAAYKAQAAIVAQLASSRAVVGGVGARTRAGGGRSSADGFVPNYVNEVEGAVASERASISAGVGGASQGAQAKVLPGFPVGGGRRETMVANTDEVIAPNFGGGQGSAIFNPDMIKSMGMPDGAIPVASGFVPNFTKTKKDKGLKKIGATSSKNEISVDVSPYGVLFGFGPRGPKEKYSVNIAQQFSEADLKSQQVSTNPRTNLLDYINYKTQGGSRIFLKGMPQGSLTPSGGADWESAEPAFRERYVAPAASAALKTMSNEIFKNVFDDEARGILDKIKIPAGAVSTSVEGGLFEQAINVGTSAMLGAKDFKSSGSERSRWDFDEDGMINEKLKNIFFPNDSRLKKADAKRSPEKGIWGSMASKVFSEERMKKKALSEMVDEAKKVPIPKTPAKSTATKGRRGAHGFIPNFAEKGLPQSTADAEKSAEKVRKEINQLSIDWGDIVIGTKKLKKESSFDVVQPRGTTGIRGASGFIPSFASALEESITREKDALAAQGSDAKVYTGQDDRLKGPKNPAGLLVANTRDEPRSGSQGVDRMLSAGRNPKTGGSAEGYVPNFILPIIAGAARLLGPLMTGLRAIGPAVARGGKALGKYAKNLRGAGKAAGDAGKASKTLGDKFSSLLLITFGVEAALSLINPILEEFGIKLPSITDGISYLMDSFRGIDRAAVDAANAFREATEGEIKALSQSIEKVDSFTGSVNKLSNAIAAGNVDSMSAFLDTVFESAKDMEGIDIGSIFAAMGDSEAMMAAAQAAKEMAQQEQGIKTLEHDLALLSETFQGMAESDRSLNKALEETEISMEGLSKSLLDGMNPEDMQKVVSTLGNMDIGAMEALVRSFPNLSTEARKFISETQSMSATLAEATLEQAKNSLAQSELKDKLKSLMGGRATISNFGSDLIKLGESMERGANSAAAALRTLTEVGEIESKSKVENLKAAGTVGSEDLLKGLAAVDTERSQKKALAEQKAVLENFTVSILKSADENSTTLDGSLKTIVDGINNQTNTAETSVGLLNELGKQGGESGKTAKTALDALKKINQTQISTQAKIQATLEANVEKLGRQAVFFQRNNILSEQQIKGFSEFRNDLQKDGETSKTQLQKLDDLKKVMTTIENLTGDDAVLSEMREQTKKLTQLEGLRSVFNELTGRDFKATSIGSLEDEINDFVIRGGLKDLDAQTVSLFKALQGAIDTAKKFGAPGVVGADEVKEAATVEINPDSLNTMTEQMSQVISDGNGQLLDINRDLLTDLNKSLEKNVSDIAQSIAQQTADNAAGIQKNQEIQKKIETSMIEGLKNMAPQLGGGATNLENNTRALKEVTEALKNNFPSKPKAGGFVPNFAPTDPISRAANTERSLGGKPVVDYQKGVGTYVRDGKTQKNFSDVRRDHPEGIGRAMKNSRSVQGAGRGFVPNFRQTSSEEDRRQGRRDRAGPGVAAPKNAEGGISPLWYDPALNVGEIPMPSWGEMAAGRLAGGWAPLGRNFQDVAWYQSEDFGSNKTQFEDMTPEELERWAVGQSSGEERTGDLLPVSYGNLLDNTQIEKVEKFKLALKEMKTPEQAKDIWPTPKIQGKSAFTKHLYGSDKTPSDILGSTLNRQSLYSNWWQQFSYTGVPTHEWWERIINPAFKGSESYNYRGGIYGQKAVASHWDKKLTELRKELFNSKQLGMVPLPFLGSDKDEYFVPFQKEGGGTNSIDWMPTKLAELSNDQLRPNFEIPVTDSNREGFNLGHEYNALNRDPRSYFNMSSPERRKALGPEGLAREILAREAVRHASNAADSRSGYILPLGKDGPIPTQDGIDFSNNNGAWTRNELEEHFNWAKESIKRHEKIIEEEKKLDERRIIPGGQNEGVRILTKIPLLEGNISQLKKFQSTLKDYDAKLFTVGLRDRFDPSGQNSSAYPNYVLDWSEPEIESYPLSFKSMTGGPSFEEIFQKAFEMKDAGFVLGEGDLRNQVPNSVDDTIGEIGGQLQTNKKAAVEGLPQLSDLLADKKTWTTTGGKRAPIDMSWVEDILGRGAGMEDRYNSDVGTADERKEVQEILSSLDSFDSGVDTRGSDIKNQFRPQPEEIKLEAGEIVRDNIYRSLLGLPPKIAQGGGSGAMAKRDIKQARIYKNNIWPDRIKSNQELLTALHNQEARAGDAMSPADYQKLNAKIEKAKRKKEIFKDEHEALAYLYSGGGDPKKGTYDTPDSNYRKMLNRYFNGKSISDGDSVISSVAGIDLTPAQFLKQYAPQLGNITGTADRDSMLRQYAKLRGLGQPASGLDGAAIIGEMAKLIDKRGASSVSSGGKITVKGTAFDDFLRKFGGKQIADLVRADDGNSEAMSLDERKTAMESLRRAVGGRENPALHFALENISHKHLNSPAGIELLKNFKGTNNRFDFTAGIPAWDFSELAGADLDITRVADMQSWKVPAAPAGDRSTFALRSRNKLMEKFESTKKRAKERAGGETASLLDHLVTGVSKEELEEWGPYLRSLPDEESALIVQDILGAGPENIEQWQQKYGSAGENVERLEKYSDSQSLGYGSYEAGPAVSKAKNRGFENEASFLSAVGSIDQGINKKIQELLETGGENPYSGTLRKLLEEGGRLTEGPYFHNTIDLEPTKGPKRAWMPFGYYGGKALGENFGGLEPRSSPSGSPSDVNGLLTELETFFNPDRQEPSLPGNARGFVPNFSAIAGEIAASRDAGYKTPVTAGQVKTMNIPGAGKTAYNTQESVFRKPGVSQPFIAPPSNSKAASGYKKAVQSKFNFDPYGSSASGFVPNFAGMDMTLLTEASYTILEAAKIFGDHSKSIEDSAKVLADAGVQMGQKYTDNIRPLTAATKSLMNSIAGISIPDSIEVSAGTLGSQMSALSSALGNVSGQIAVEVNVPDVSVQVAADSAGEQISTTIVEIMQQVIPGIVKAQLNTEEARNIITAEVNKELGLSG